VPDVFVVHEEALSREGACFEPGEVLLVVEVLSKDNRSHDLILKRHDYAKAGIPQYWIVDPDARTLTVLGDIGQGGYHQLAEIRPGERWTAEHPYPLRLDPVEFC
jgi:Uma2 family endonuclease